MRIPYHCLRFSEKDEHTWGVNFTRWINRKGEYLKWSFVPSSEGGFVSKYGHLTGITGVKPATHIELLPYVVSKAETEPKGAGNPDGKDLMGNVGFDVKYALSSNLILDAAVNPDFGQVELDQPVLNLSAFETWFPERRPFFIEGADLFETNFSLFYSRRVGRPPWRSVDDGEGIYYIDYPDNTTIVGAAKLTGKLSSGTSIAVLNAVTDEELAEYAAETNVVLDSAWIGDSLITEIVSADTVSRTGVVEPVANFTVVRVKQDVFRNSSVGGMLTVVGQKSLHPCVTGGFDWRLVTNNNNWGTDGQLIFSRVDPDNVGYGFSMNIRKRGGRHLQGSIGVTVKSPELRINRLGFTSRVDTRQLSSWIQYRTNDDWWIIRNSYNNLNFHSSWNYDGINHSLGGSFDTYIEFTNFWSLGGTFSVQAEKYSDLETRGNGLWVWPEYPTFAWWLSINTDERKRLRFNWNPGNGTDRGGRWWTNYFGFTYRPETNMEFSLGANYHLVDRGTFWIYNGDDGSLFADLDQERVTLHASAGVVANRNLSIQLSAQGLISGLDYYDYRYYRGGQNYSDPVSGFNTDRNYLALNSTLIVRWEYRPGSTVYLVWTRARSESDWNVNNLDISRDFNRLFSGNARNVFFAKATYWLNI